MSPKVKKQRRPAGVKHVNPPEFDLEDGYEAWKTKIKKWCTLTTIDEKALHISVKLKGQAYKAVEDIDAEKLRGEDGMKVLWEALDKTFLPDKIQRHFDLYCLIHCMKRDSLKGIHDFLNDFDYAYQKLQAVHGVLPEPIPAFMLLLACNLPENDGRTVRAGLRDDVTYSSMRDTLKRVFGAEQCDQFKSVSGSNISTASTSGGKTENDVILFARGGRNSRSVRRRRDGRSVSRPRSGSRFSSGRQFNDEGCFQCGSFRHIRRHCPEIIYGGSLGNNGRSGDRVGDYYPRGYNWRDNPRGYNSRDRSRITDRARDTNPTFPVLDTAEVNLSFPINYSVSTKDSSMTEIEDISLFVGCADNGGYKLKALIDDSQGFGILDSGCANTVCGESWLQNYLD